MYVAVVWLWLSLMIWKFLVYSNSKVEENVMTRHTITLMALAIPVTVAEAAKTQRYNTEISTQLKIFKLNIKPFHIQQTHTQCTESGRVRDICFRVGIAAI